MKDKIILDLCGGTGAWSKPYLEAGYDVRNITLPDLDVRTYKPPDNVYGILFAFPCTHFAVSGARWWKEKDVDGRTLEDTKILTSGLIIIANCQPFFWVLENPVGRLIHWLGKPKMYFNPYDYGNPWTKKTVLWGKFNIPIKNPVKPVGQWMGRKGKPEIVDHTDEYLSPDWIHKLPPSPDRAMKRSITPSGFARAFYEANK